METAKVTVDKRFGPEFEGTYEFRPVLQGEYEDVITQYMDSLGKIEPKEILKVNRRMLWIGLVKQPETKPLNEERLAKGLIPFGLSSLLQRAYDRVNGLSPEEHRFLPEPSSGISQTHGSRRSHSMRPSDGQNESTELRVGRRSMSAR